MMQTQAVKAVGTTEGWQPRFTTTYAPTLLCHMYDRKSISLCRCVSKPYRVRAVCPARKNYLPLPVPLTAIVLGTKHPESTISVTHDAKLLQLQKHTNLECCFHSGQGLLAAAKLRLGKVILQIQAGHTPQEAHKMAQAHPFPRRYIFWALLANTLLQVRRGHACHKATPYLPLKLASPSKYNMAVFRALL